MQLLPRTANAPPASVPASLAWQQTTHCHDVDEQASSQPQWSLRYEQLSMGRFHGCVQLLQLPGLRMVHEEASCATRQRGQIGEGQYGFAMPLRLPSHATFNGQPLTTDALMIGRSEDLDLCTPSGFGLVGVVVDAGLLNALWERMYQKGVSAWLERQGVVHPNPMVANDLRSLHLKTLADVAALPALLQDPNAVLQLRDAILIEWIEAIPRAVDISDLATGEARKRVVDRACEMMLSQPDNPPSILQVCARIGASPRKLEYCFRSVLGISPAKYLKAARLSGVRRELRRAREQGVSVQDIAARWGFWHMGEFSAAYKRQSGELPSETRRGDGSRAGQPPPARSPGPAWVFTNENRSQ